MNERNKGKSDNFGKDLARFARDLPTPIDIAKLAVNFPGCHTAEAIRRAVRLYLDAAEFHEQYGKAELRERARMCGEHESALRADLSDRSTPIPQPDKFPATFGDFLKVLVNVKTPADSEKRLRDFFRANCPQGQEPDNFGPDEIGRIKKTGFPTKSAWNELGFQYLEWWQQEVAKKNRENRRGPKIDS